MLLDRGVDAYLSKCMTLTFPTRPEPPESGQVFIVDVDLSKIHIPDEIKKNACYVSQYALPSYGEHLKALMADKLLDIYKREARLVVTTRLHCALPCIAMGIPVVFFGDQNDYRVSVVKEVGGTIYPLWDKKSSLKTWTLSKVRQKYSVQSFYRDCAVDWNPKAINIDKEKSSLIDRFNQELSLLEQRNRG